MIKTILKTDPQIKSVHKKIGKVIKEARIKRGLSTRELAQELGVSAQQVQKYEQGVNRMCLARLAMTAKALDKNLFDFIELIFDIRPQKFDLVEAKREKLMQNFNKKLLQIKNDSSLKIINMIIDELIKF